MGSYQKMSNNENKQQDTTSIESVIMNSPDPQKTGIQALAIVLNLAHEKLKSTADLVDRFMANILAMGDAMNDAAGESAPEEKIISDEPTEKAPETPSAPQDTGVSATKANDGGKHGKNKKKESFAKQVSAPLEKEEKKDDFFARSNRAISSKPIPTEEQRFVFGKRTVEEVSNSSLFLTRFGYKHAFANKGVTCDEYYDAQTDKLLGTVPRISLDTVWKKAKQWVALGNGEMPKITEIEWDNAKNKLIRYIKRNDKSKEAIVRNVMAIPELAFRELYISRAAEALKLIDYAVKYEITETEELRRKWSKIKKYKHKVSLLAASGGIFTSEEVNVLRSLNINYLNDIRRQSIYVLKHYLFNRDFSNIITEINEAFKEDLERRRDKRYKVYPFLIGYVALSLMTFVGYIFKYDLIKDAQDKALLTNVGAVVWIFGLLVMLRGIIRARRRRRTKRPDYRYFSPKVKRATRVLTVFSLFSICSLLVFFQRYDGYNDLLYYRDLDDANIAVAGLRNDEAFGVNVPERIDDKTVTEIDLFAFRKDSFESVTLPSTLVKIDNSAFSGCSKLMNVTNTASVTEIGKKAFSGCSTLGSISFGELSYVGKSAFSGCTTLQTIEFTKPIEQIPDGAFRDCVSIVYATSFENVKVVGKNAFRGCTSLKDVNLENVVSIGEKAFYGCTSFENIVVSSVTESIGKDAFTECTNVKSITVPFIGPDRENAKNKSFGYIINSNDKLGEDGFSVTLTDITSVHGKAFNKCASVRTISLPDSVTEIEEGAFNGAKSLKSVNLPSNITVLYDGLFSGCEDLTTVVGGESVKVIGAKVFEDCTSLTEISFPNVTSIGEEAFIGCYNLANLGSLTALTELGSYAFRDCSGIKSADISSVTTLGEGVFYNCYSLASVTVNGGIGTIPKYTFYGNTALSEFTVPSGITEIGERAFEGSAVSNVIWSESVTVIGKSAFRSTSINQLVIPESVTNIGKNAFADTPVKELEASFIGESADSTKNGFKHVFGTYANLTDVTLTGMNVIGKTTLDALKGSVVNITLAEGTEKIEAKAFEGYIALKTVNLPASLTEIGDKAFYDCDSLISVNLEDTSLNSCGKSAFADNYSLKAITVPDTLTTVPESFASECWSLESIMIEDGVKVIGSSSGA